MQQRTMTITDDNSGLLRTLAKTTIAMVTMKNFWIASHARKDG